MIESGIMAIQRWTLTVLYALATASIISCFRVDSEQLPFSSTDISSNSFKQFNALVQAVVPATDGTGDVYVGGYFTTYNRTASNRIIRLNEDGFVDPSFTTGAGFNNAVRTIALANDGSGDVYVGGDFTSYNGVTSNRIIRLNADGSADSGFDVGSGFNSTAQVIVPFTDGSGDIYVGGGFTAYNGTTATRIIRLNPDGTLDTGFTSWTGFNNTVKTLSPETDGTGDLYVGGYFTSNAGVNSNRIIRLNSNGTVDAGFALGTGFDTWVSTIIQAADGSGDLYVGGDFSNFNGSIRNKIIRLNMDGTLDAGFTIGTGFNLSVRGIENAPDGSGDIYVVGAFNIYDGNNASRVIRINSDGTVDTGFDIGTGFDSLVSSVVAATDATRDVYFGGAFTAYNGTGSDGTIRVQADGTVAFLFATGSGFNNSVTTIAQAANGSGDLYAGGFFTTYNGTPANRIIRLNPDGSQDSAFAFGTGFDLEIYKISPALDGSGDIYVGGAFINYNGTGSRRIIRLNSNGTVDTGFSVGAGFNNSVWNIAPATDGSGDVYVVGDFTFYDTTASNRIIRLNQDGSVDAGFAVGTGFNNAVEAIALTTDGTGDLYVGGAFTAYIGTPTSRIARLTAGGTLDAGFIVGSGFDDSIYTLAMTQDGTDDVYAGGSFTTYNGAGSSGIIRLNPTGMPDAGFFSGSGYDSWVSTIASATDGSGDVYVVGDFTSYNGSSTNFINRLNPDGTMDAGLVTASGFNNSAFAVAIAQDGTDDVHVAGLFRTYSNNTVDYLTTLNPNGSID